MVLKVLYYNDICTSFEKKIDRTASLKHLALGKRSKMFANLYEAAVYRLYILVGQTST